MADKGNSLSLFTRADILLIFLIAVAAAGGILLKNWLYPAPAQVTAVISIRGNIIKSIPLRQGYHERIDVEQDGHYNRIEAQDRRIRVEDADCPDRVCISAGWISLPPQQIVCLPNQVVVRLESSTAGDVDEITK